MLNLTRLLKTPVPSQSNTGLKVIWTPTLRCNLGCKECFTASQDQPYPGELSTEEALDFLDDLASFGTVELALAGGEPFCRPDMKRILARAGELGLPVDVHSNGSLIGATQAKWMKAAGVQSVNIGLEGPAEMHDAFCGVEGSYAAAVEGMRVCKAAGLKTGLRLRLGAALDEGLGWALDLARELGSDRLLFVHQGSGLKPAQARGLVGRLLETALASKGSGLEILTSGQPADAPYLLLRLADMNAKLASDLCEALQQDWQGNSWPWRQAHVDAQGGVHPDFFWQAPLGNIRDKPLFDIWNNPAQPVLRQLRDRLLALKGRCAACSFVRVCGGGQRSLAAVASGDPMAPDPHCYLTDEEVRWGLVGL